MNKVTKQDLIAEFHRLADELGKKPTLGEFEDGEYSSTPVYKRFESYEELKDAAGYETGQQKHTDEELLEDLRRVAEEIGRTPPIEVYDEHGNHNSKTLKRRFGNWNETLQTAGLEPTEHSEHWKDNEPVIGEKKYGTTETVECAYCGDTKQVQPSETKGRDRFYCNHDCKGKFMSQQTGEESRVWKGGKETITCERCGDTKEVKAAIEDKARFCSQDCMLKWRSETIRGENHPRHKEETKEIYYGPSFQPQRKKALERDNHACRVCGRSEATQVEIYGCGLNCHHIRKFREFDHHEEANRLENLVMLCSQCHQHVENYQINVPAGVWHRGEATKAVVSEVPIPTNLTLHIA